jgi:hypothetical protein
MPPTSSPQDQAQALLDLASAIDGAAEAAASLAKPWYLSRTLIVNGLVFGVAAAEARLGLIEQLLGVDIYTLIALGLPLLNAALRLITSQPLAASAGPAGGGVGGNGTGR